MTEKFRAFAEAGHCLPFNSFGDDPAMGFNKRALRPIAKVLGVF